MEVWSYKADFCKDFGGVLVLLAHPIHIVKHLNKYARFLRSLKSNGFRIIRLKDLPTFLELKPPQSRF